MCMIALRPAAEAGHITQQTIDLALGRHPDGFGYAARVDGRLVVKTYGPNDRKAFREDLIALDATGVEYAAHFRFATSGPKAKEQSHPFVYSDPDPEVGPVAVLHNGIIGISHDRGKESDTSAFVRLVLAQLPSRWWSNPALVYLVEEAIGWSKLTIMTATETVLINERSGTWDGGIWYSSEHRPTYTPSTSTWTPKVATGKPSVEARQQPDPKSKRSQKRAARQQRKGLPKGGGTIAAVTAPIRGGMVEGTSKVLTHEGHNVSLLVDIDRTRDGEYYGAIGCDSCATMGDVWVIDEALYLDLAHVSKSTSLVPYALPTGDALPF